MAASPSQPCPGRSWVPRLPLWTPCPTGRRAVTLSAPSRSTGTLASGSGTRGRSTMNPDRCSQGSPEEEGGERGGTQGGSWGSAGSRGAGLGAPLCAWAARRPGEPPRGQGRVRSRRGHERQSGSGAGTRRAGRGAERLVPAPQRPQRPGCSPREAERRPRGEFSRRSELSTESVIVSRPEPLSETFPSTSPGKSGHRWETGERGAGT